MLNTPGDYKGHWIDVNDDGSLSFNRTIDFENIFTDSRGGAVSYPWRNLRTDADNHSALTAPSSTI